jgi:beta-glucosidase
VRGVQGPSLDTGVIATGKHLVGHGLAEGGLNQAPVHVGRRELEDEHLVAFEAAIRDAGLFSIMPAYCEMDGVPCHASSELLTGILRDRWAFEGIVVSDYLGIEQIADQHHLTVDPVAAAIAALTAGVDVDLPRSLAFGPYLREAARDGRIDAVYIDTAVERVLSAKFRLGLFDRPYSEIATDAELADMDRDERRVARSLAVRSMVLLENDGVLPLRSDLSKVAVMGPLAASARDLLGDYSHVVHMATLTDARNQAVMGGVYDATSAVDDLEGRRTVLDALRDRLGEGSVEYRLGTGLRDGSDADIVAATEAARHADVAVVVLGERSGLSDDSTTGEFRDRQTLGFLGRQQELLEAVVATGTPVVLVVISGRPLSIPWAAEHCSAVVFAWVPGEEGPDALADVLTGVESPGGKLPVTVVRGVGQVPLTYRHHPSGGRSNPRGDHVDGPATPLWPFGYGLSYTSFELSELKLSTAAIPTSDGVVGVEVRVTNVGSRPGDEVVQLYARHDEATVARPVLELCGFARVTLGPGESTWVRFELHAEQLCYAGLDYRRVVEPGRKTLSLGTSSAFRPLSAVLELVGPETEVVDRRWFVTPVTITPP